MHNDRPFLERWGFVHERIGGFYLHHIVDADPGKDLHDHPWSFISIVLRGKYEEAWSTTTNACTPMAGRHKRTWRWLSIHRMPLTIAHRITRAEPRTWTLVLRGPTRRVWGFYMPTGRVEWTEYPYDQRRPCSEVKS